MRKMTGQQLIAAERKRQIESEGWTPEHDDQQRIGDLERAAFCYRDASGEGSAQPGQWPWDAKWWKPQSRQRNLVRAGALYLAASEVAERAGDFERRNHLKDHADSCSILLDSIQSVQANALASHPTT